jgi:hypothetical protein
VLARLICFLLGHCFDPVDTYDSPQPHIRVIYVMCARCRAPGLEVLDLHDDE